MFKSIIITTLHLICLGTATGWRATGKGPHFLIINLKNPYLVTKLSTQYAKKPCDRGWWRGSDCGVKSYRAMFSVNGLVWEWINDKRGKPQLFHGRTDKELPYDLEVPVRVSIDL